MISAAAALVAAPIAGPAAADPEDDGHSIEEELEQALEEYVEAEKELEDALERQEELEERIADNEKRIEELSVEVNDFAHMAYTNGGLPSATAILTTGSPDSAISGLSMVNYLGDQSGRQLQELVDARETLAADEQALEDEVEAAEKALAKKEKARDAAQREVDAQSGPSGGDYGSAEPAPRNSDGSWPSESCAVDDPTTDGCITARMNHALNQARSAGFDRYTSCYRPTEDGGEHPRGRACDFSAQAGGFGGVASGGDKTYGDNLAYWFTENADSLGVMYVIWYNQFWDPANGWGPYSGGNGTPSGDHTNHVHVSMF
ncbi:hypothetical protein LX16_4579 [Stackebrandtia albiflava]|uniref:ARB-07466-like C-terminal domain-containing protein n=1 Tax=Stackebrandtia albiflava TaxID=406432 RepID=A0A562URW2_9ACTN|nr:hypothetical protein LX16_4579 [Stackebrandtia albiflava]